MLGENAVNYILNGDFEDSGSEPAYWSKIGNARVVGSASLFNNLGIYCLMLSPSDNASASISQYVSLKPGDYTLSFPYHTSNAYVGNANVKITSLSASAVDLTENITLSNNYSTGAASSFSYTFNVPEGFGERSVLK